MNTWPEILREDYQAAVIRLATLTEARTQYVVFASVELYPTEIPLPPADVKLQTQNTGDVRANIGVTAVSLTEGLSWYESALSGFFQIPGTSPPIPLTVVPLAPEPMLGRLLLSNNLPCGRQWHGGLRLNRLVPMSSLPEPVARLSSGRENAQHAKLRFWFADLLGFDVLAHDDLLGGLVLLAPNPVTRGVTTYIKEVRADGSELLGVKAALRRGHTADTLQIRLREERPGGSAVLERRLDRYGMAELDIPEQCEQTGVQLVCDKRGVLSLEAPGYFFRSVSVSTQIVQRAGKIDVPPRKKGEETTTQLLTSMPASIKPKPVPQNGLNAATQLRLLQGRREKRTGYWRPDGFMREQAENEHIFFNNRSEAVRLVHRLVRSARRQVIFVDPYFDHIDLRQFALMQQYEEVAVAVMTGRGENLWSRNSVPDGEAEFTGDAFLADLTKLEAELTAMRRLLPDVRVMGGRARVYHDRFLLIDDEVWHIGHSFNQIGYNELAVAVHIPRPEQIADLIREDLAQAERFVDAWPKIKALRPQRSRWRQALASALRRAAQFIGGKA